MSKFKNIAQALQAINDDAASRAWAYLEREVPNTAQAIQYLVAEDWTEEKILANVHKIYGITEEKTMHKIGLIIKALISERGESE